MDRAYHSKEVNEEHMADNAESRRNRLLEILAVSSEPLDLDTLAKRLKCDARTIRRDLDLLQQLLHRVQGLEVRRGKVMVARAGYSPGYFTAQAARNLAAKEAIARAVVASLADDQAVALTAGSTPYFIAKEMRRSVVESGNPQNLIVFTNSVPALQELIAADISAGVLGEIYDPEDRAFHTPEFHSAFQPSVAIVGASGILIAPNGGGASVELYSHRAEEAAFMKLLLDRVPEIIVAADSTKLGKRHPWNFGGSVLHGKKIHLVTDNLTSEQQNEIEEFAPRFAKNGMTVMYTAAGSPAK
jgi:DeoR family transcriptional regulator, glycerol-3-phosphate regulon repressor